MNERAVRHSDLLTVVCIAALAYGLCNLAHEGVGHGGTCLLVGCSPRMLTSISFDGNTEAVTDLARRMIAAGGAIANALMGLIALVFLRRIRATQSARWWFCWLIVAISFMQATGYLLFSGVAGIGDWATVVANLPGEGAWRIVMAVVGALTYVLVVRRSMRWLGARLDADSPRARIRAGYRLTLPAYAAGAALQITAGTLDPGGAALLMISGVAASLGGTSGLAWGPQLMPRDIDRAAPATSLIIERDWRWIIAALVFAVAFVMILGRGIRF